MAFQKCFFFKKEEPIPFSNVLDTLHERWRRNVSGSDRVFMEHASPMLSSPTKKMYYYLANDNIPVLQLPSEMNTNHENHHVVASQTFVLPSTSLYHDGSSTAISEMHPRMALTEREREEQSDGGVNALSHSSTLLTASSTMVIPDSEKHEAHSLFLNSFGCKGGTEKILKYCTHAQPRVTPRIIDTILSIHNAFVGIRSWIIGGIRLQGATSTLFQQARCVKDIYTYCQAVGENDVLFPRELRHTFAAIFEMVCDELSEAIHHAHSDGVEVKKLTQAFLFMDLNASDNKVFTDLACNAVCLAETMLCVLGLAPGSLFTHKTSLVETIETVANRGSLLNILVAKFLTNKDLGHLTFPQMRMVTSILA
eukprot:m.23822 g.23822  ORF g.23822 m.23822 type:complete len:367 (+) comp5587_c0_seq2:4307-5407(+)